MQLGVRADPTCLPIPPGVRALDAGFEPAQPEIRRLYCSVEAVAVGGSDPAWPAHRKRTWLTCRFCLVAEACPSWREQAGEMEAQHDNVWFDADGIVGRRFGGCAGLVAGAGLYRYCCRRVRPGLPARCRRCRSGLDRLDCLQSLLSDPPAGRLSAMGATRRNHVGIAEPDPVAVARDAAALGFLAVRCHSRHPGSPPIAAGRDVRGGAAGGGGPAPFLAVAGTVAV